MQKQQVRRRRKPFGGYISHRSNNRNNNNINNNTNDTNNMSNNDYNDNRNANIAEFSLNNDNISDPEYKTDITTYNQYLPFSPLQTPNRRLFNELSPTQLQGYQEINDHSLDVRNKMRFMDLSPLTNSRSANS